MCARWTCCSRESSRTPLAAASLRQVGGPKGRIAWSPIGVAISARMWVFRFRSARPAGAVAPRRRGHVGLPFFDRAMSARRSDCQGGSDGREPQQRPEAWVHLDLLRLRHRRQRETPPGVQGRVRNPPRGRGRPRRGAHLDVPWHLGAPRPTHGAGLPGRRVAADPAATDTRREHLRRLRPQPSPWSRNSTTRV